MGVRGSSKKAAVVMAGSQPMGISENVYLARAQSSNMEDECLLLSLERGNFMAFKQYKDLNVSF